MTIFPESSRKSESREITEPNTEIKIEIVTDPVDGAKVEAVTDPTGAIKTTKNL